MSVSFDTGSTATRAVAANPRRTYLDGVEDEPLVRLWTKKDWREAKDIGTRIERLLAGTVEPHSHLTPNDPDVKATEALCAEMLDSLASAMKLQTRLLHERGLTEPPDD